jgi:hypothetical protein
MAAMRVAPEVSFSGGFLVIRMSSLLLGDNLKPFFPAKA